MTPTPESIKKAEDITSLPGFGRLSILKHIALALDAAAEEARREERDDFMDVFFRHGRRKSQARIRSQK